MFAPQAPSRPAPGWRRWTLAGLAALTLVSALGVLLAPVTADDPVVSWPRTGEPARSTVLPLVPYRPLQLDATIPCATLAALEARGGGTALSTMPADVTVPSRPGLRVAASGGTVTVVASDRDLLAEPLPAGGCSYRVVADSDGVRVLRDGSQLAAAPGLPAPQVAQLVTDAETLPAARGLAVTLHTDARYESSPTVLKTVLLTVHAAALLALLLLAWRTWRGSGLGLVRPRPGPADAVVLAVSALWVVLSPVNFDDPWYALMARGATDSGAVGNAVYMFNVTENPFVASQYALGVWSWLGQSLLPEGAWGLAWLRLLPLLYGLIVWLLLRFALVSGDASHSSHPHSPRWAVWALALAHMLWWLPYGMTLRPEPLIVVFAAAALLLAELARRARSVGALTAATAAAALGVSVSPSGLVALAPLVLALPWLWSWLRHARPADRVAALLALVAVGTALIPVGFADATLGDVLESTAVHQWYYVTFAWYEEAVHYETLLSLPDSSQWSRRAPVLLTLAVIALVALGQLARYLGYRNGNGNGSGRGRGEPDGPLHRLMLRSTVMSVVALALLALTPTKWVNHFGAVEAVPTVLLATALRQAPLVWPSRATLRSGRRTALLPATAGTALLVWAISVSYAGPNFWRPYSDHGQPFGDHIFAEITPSRVADMAPRIGWLFASNPAIWLGLALVFAAAMWRRRGRGGLTPDGGLLRVSSVSVVVLTLLVFAWAPIRQYPGWTVAMSMSDAARGQPCGLADHVRVLDSDRDTAQPGPPVGTATRRGGFAATSGLPPPVPPPVPGSRVWHDAPVGGPSIGTLLTPWYPLPAGGQATHLLVPLLGDELERQQVWLQYGDGSRVTGAVAVRVDPEVAADDWQQAPVPLDALGADRPQQVRLAVEDQVAGRRQWIAVGEPRLARWRPVTAVTSDRPVYADQVSASLWPCVDQVSVEHGIAGAPAVTLLADENFRRSFLDIAFRVRQGGTQVPTARTSAAVRVPARLAAPGPPTLPWGRVERVVYDHPVGLVDVRVDERRRWGTTRLPTLSGEDYNGYYSGTAPWNTTR